MTFFQDLPKPPERPRGPRYLPPVWAGPPAHELPTVIHVGRFLHRTPRLVLAVKSVEVFSTGCSIDVVWTVRRIGESDQEWAAASDVFFRHGPSGPGWSVNDPSSGLLFGVAFPDGATTTSAHVRPGMFDGSMAVTGPVLMMNGQGGQGGDDELAGSARLWVWPLPEGGDLRLVGQWQDAGMPEQSILLDGDQLGAAAGVVQKY